MCDGTLWSKNSLQIFTIVLHQFCKLRPRYNLMIKKIKQFVFSSKNKTNMESFHNSVKKSHTKSFLESLIKKKSPNLKYYNCFINRPKTLFFYLRSLIILGRSDILLLKWFRITWVWPLAWPAWKLMFWELLDIFSNSFN